MTHIVTVGNNAQSFHDASTGITVCKGEKVTLRNNQYSSPRIRQALATGHLILCQDDAHSQVTSEEDINKLDKKVASQFNKGMAIEKIATGVTLEQAKQLAAMHEVTVEDDDTVVDIIGAILED